jgi:hypothetical protein
MTRGPSFARRIAAGIAIDPSDVPPQVASAADIGSAQSDACIRADGRPSADLRHKRALRRLWLDAASDEWLHEAAELDQLETLVVNGTSSSNLAVLGRAVGLQRLLVRDAPQLKSIEFVSTLRGLKVLGVLDAPRIWALEPLRELTQLTAFAMEISPRGADAGMEGRVQTLDPLAALLALESLHLVSLKVADERLEPLTVLKSLKVLECGAFFPATELRKLHLATPQLACQWFSVMDTPLYDELYRAASKQSSKMN